MRSLAVTCVALCLAFLAATCSGRLLGDTVPTAALLVHETLMTKAVAVIVPTVEGAILNMKPITYKSVNFNVTDLKVSKFALGAVSVAFVAPNVVQATFPSVTLEIPPTAFTVGLGVNCDGSLGVVAQKEYLQANITLSRSPVNGSGALTTAVTARFDVLNITLAFTQGFLCEIAQSAIESYIRSTIESSLGPLISSKIQELGSEIFADLPLRFAADPEVTASGLETVVELLPRLAGPPVTVPLPPFTSIATRDVEVRVTQQSMNDLLAALPRNGSVPLPSRFNTSADSLGHVWPKLVGFCTVAAACPLAVDYVLINPVNVTLSNQAALIATDNVFLTLSAVNGKTFVPALVVAATLEIAVSNISVVNQSVVDFKIGFPVIDGKLLSSAIGPLGDFQFYVSLLRVLLQGIVATAFNSAFKGLGPIGPLDDVIVQIGDSKVDVGLNVNVTGLRR